MSITATIIGGPVQLTGNPVWIHCTGGASPADASEYKILMKVISLDGQLVGSPFIDAIAPDGSGEAWFNISGYVDQPVKARFQYPVTGAMVAYPTQAFNIQIVAGESFIDGNGDLQETWGEPSDEFQMLKGGVSQRQIAMWEAAGTNFYSVYLVGRKWLSYRPWGDYIHTKQPAKLWFMVVQNASATFTVKAYYDDGTMEAYSEPVSLSTDNLYEFNCNPFHLGIPLETAGKRLSHFDVSLESGGQPVSDVRRFHYDWRHCERPFWLLFANSIGGVDDVYLSGFAQENFKAEGSTVLKPAQRGDAVHDPTLVVPNRFGRNAFSINTGFKVSSQMRHLRDLLISRQVWLLFPNTALSAYLVIPVVIDNTEETIVDHSEDLYSLTIEMTEAHNNKFSFDNRLF